MLIKSIILTNREKNLGVFEMKKKGVIVLSCLFLVFIVGFASYLFYKKEVAKEAPQALVTEKEYTPIYSVPSPYTEREVKGYLTKDTEYRNYMAFNQDWWRVAVGNDVGYVPRKETKTASATAVKDQSLTSAFEGETLLVKKATPIYRSMSKKAKKIGEFDQHTQIEAKDTGQDWMEVNVGGLIGYIPKDSVEKQNGVPVLMYHHLLKDDENHNFRDVSTTITPEAFEEQMKWLHDNGYTAITLKELEPYIQGKKVLPEKSVVITFDDGIISSREYAYPILEKYGFKAENFIITSRISQESKPFNPDRLDFLSYQDMEKMKDVFSFGSHTNALHSMNEEKKRGMITQLPYDQVLADFKQSRQVLPSHSAYFAYPFGHLNETSVQAVKDAGFTLAFTTQKGYVFPGDNPLLLNRFGIGPDITLEKFQEIFK
jgi:peptidoglycan/xylan/chitin deacetylase (PgdA/CDA1 family)